MDKSTFRDLDELNHAARERAKPFSEIWWCSLTLSQTHVFNGRNRRPWPRKRRRATTNVIQQHRFKRTVTKIGLVNPYGAPPISIRRRTGLWQSVMGKQARTNRMFQNPAILANKRDSQNRQLALERSILREMSILAPTPTRRVTDNRIWASIPRRIAVNVPRVNLRHRLVNAIASHKKSGDQDRPAG